MRYLWLPLVAFLAFSHPAGAAFSDKEIKAVCQHAEADLRDLMEAQGGARTGMEKLYHNSERDDFANYYDHETFHAFEGLSRRPWMHGEEHGLGEVLEQNAHDIWELMQAPKTHVYLAGLQKTREAFYEAMEKAAGSAARFRLTREELQEQNRWSELIYD